VAEDQYNQMNSIIKKANRGLLSFQRLGMIDEFEAMMVEQQQYWAYLTL